MKSHTAVLALILGLGAVPALVVAQPRITVQTGTTEFRDITIGKAETGTLAIARVVLTGFTTEGERARATRAEFQNLVVTFGKSRTEIPSIILTDVSAPANLFETLTKGSNQNLAWADVLQATSAAEIKIASAKLRDAGSRSEADYSDFTLTALANGLVQSGRLARSISKTVAPTGEEISSTIGESLYGKMDLAEMVRFFTGGGTGAAKPLVDRMSIASFTMKMPQAEVDFGKVEITGVFGRAPAMEMPLAAIQAMSGALPEFEKGANAKQLAAYYRELLQHFRVDRYAFNGAKVKTDIGIVDLGNIVMEKFSGNALGRFSIAGASMMLPTGPIRLGEFEIKGFNWKGLLDLGLEAAVTGKEPDIKPEQVMALIPSMDVLRFAKITAGTPFGPLSLEEFRIEVPPGPKGPPESLALTIKELKADVSKLPPDAPLANEFKMLGYGPMSANAQLKARMITAERTALIEVPSFEISNVGKIDLAVRVANVGPGGVDDLDDAPIEQITLGITDGGLGERAFRALAQGAGISPQAMRAAMAVELKGQATAMFGSALTPGSAEAVENFIKNGQHVVVTVKPKPGAKPPTLGEVGDLPAIQDRVTVTIAAGLPSQLRRLLDDVKPR